MSRGWNRAKSNATDLLWAKAVRQRDGRCRRCGRTAPYQLHAAHIFSRRYAAVRWDLGNGLTLCALHHRIFHADRVGWEDFTKGQLGTREYDRLLLLAKGPAKKAPDEKMVRAQLREELKRLESREAVTG